MPLEYKPTKHAFYTEGDSMTEPEHLDSCDINKMVKSALNGQQIRGSSAPHIYGHDDTTMDGVHHRILKDQTEAELRAASKTELPSEFESHFPPKVREKFGLKFKASAAQAPASPETSTPEPKTPPDKRET